jgi:hypothetical protein
MRNADYKLLRLRQNEATVGNLKTQPIITHTHTQNHKTHPKRRARGMDSSRYQTPPKRRPENVTDHMAWHLTGQS